MNFLNNLYGLDGWLHVVYTKDVGTLHQSHGM